MKPMWNIVIWASHVLCGPIYIRRTKPICEYCHFVPYGTAHEAHVEYCPMGFISHVYGIAVGMKELGVKASDEYVHICESEG